MGASLAVSAGGFGRLSSGPRRQVLPDYSAWVQRLGQTGETAEHRYCLLITRAGPDAVPTTGLAPPPTIVIPAP